MKIEAAAQNTRYRFIMVGLGATGSQLLPFIAQLLNNYKGNSITLLDGDIVERKNLDNQKFLELDIDRHKSEVLAERYQSVYPDLDIAYATEYVTSKEQLKPYLKCDGMNVIPVLISCVDNNASRKIFDEAFYDEKVTDLIYIDSGNGTVDRNGQIVVGYKHGRREQCADTQGNYNYYATKLIAEVRLKPVCDVFPNIREDDDKIEHHTSCSRVSDKYPQNIGTNIYAAANLFTIVNNIVAFNDIPKQVCYFDAEQTQCISREMVC